MDKTDHFQFSFIHDCTKKSRITNGKTANPEVLCILKDREFADKKTANYEGRLYTMYPTYFAHTMPIALNFVIQLGIVDVGSFGVLTCEVISSRLRSFEASLLEVSLFDVSLLEVSSFGARLLGVSSFDVSLLKISSFEACLLEVR